MSRQRLSPLVFGIAMLVAAAVLAEGWLLLDGSRTAKTAALTLARKQREWRRLAALKPAPTAAQADIIEADLARAEATLAALGKVQASERADANPRQAVPATFPNTNTRNE